MIHDLGLAAAWLAVLAAGIAVGLLARARGLASTHVRDLLHVGTGVWVLGLPCWRAPLVPIAIVCAALAGALVVPTLSTRVTSIARFRAALASGDERWSGIITYVVSYTLLTAAALFADPFPASGALLALSLGDGLGGLFGRAFGRHQFTTPGGKPKSLEGSFAVALFAAAGVLLSAVWLDVPVDALVVGGAAVVAAAAEATAPRATDNLFVPAAVWAFLVLVS